MADGATISIDRTAVPVEWDEIKTELTKLSTALGPEGSTTRDRWLGSSTRPARTWTGTETRCGGRCVTVRHYAHAVRGPHRSVLDHPKLAGVRVCAVLEHQQIVQFGGRLASVSDLLATSSDELGTALSDLNLAVGDVQRFVADNRDGLSESVQRLADATQVLADKRPEIERVLHSGPTSLANFYQIYKPQQGSLTARLPSATSVTRSRGLWCGGGRCYFHLGADRGFVQAAVGPVLESMTMNYPPILTNPATGEFAAPGDIQSTEPGLPTGAGVAADVKSPLDMAPTATVPKDLTGLMQPGGGR